MVRKRSFVHIKKDTPLREIVDMSNPTPTVRRLIETTVDSFGPAMTLEQAIEWLKKINNMDE
jgi:hypothetical protein